MNPVLEKLLSAKGGAAGTDKMVLPDAVSRTEGEFLQALIAEHRCRNTLEVGMGHGVSALFICDALVKTGGKRHTVIDPGQSSGYHNAGLKNVQDAGYGRLVEFFEMRSDSILPKLVDEGRAVDLALIDGWHTFDYTLVDFYYIDRMLKPGGIVVFDDADWPAIRKVCRYIAANLNYQPIVPECEQPHLVFSWKRKLFNRLIASPAAGSWARRFFKSEILVSDKMLGLMGSIIAFRKEADDRRRWDFHREF